MIYSADLVPGTVTLVGGGPGDPGLLTVAGFEAVRQADVILYDRLAPTAIMDENPQAERIPVGKVPRGPYVPQERTNELLIEHAKAGRKVVRLKGGDSFVFGRGGEEWQACAAAGVPVRIIPGVTSCVAGPELMGVPLTHRHMVQGFTVVSGHVAPGDTRSGGLGPDRQDRHYPGDSHGSGPHWRHRYPPHGRRVGRRHTGRHYC